MGAVIGGGVAAFLSVCILSRAIVDNPLYRFAQSLLVGVALGYVTAVLVRSAILPPTAALINGTASQSEMIVSGAGLLLGLLLLTRFGRQRRSAWANLPLALLFGVGAALAVIGAVRGTILPQVVDTVRLRGLTGDVAAQIGAAVLAVLTITTLLAFTYSMRGRADGPVRRGRAGGLLGRFGRLLILAAFGVFFAAAVTTYIAALVGQIQAIAAWALALFGF